MMRVEVFKIRSMWGNIDFEFACSTTHGHSGGIVSVWDPSIFSKDNIFFAQITTLLFRVIGLIVMLHVSILTYLHHRS